MYNSLNIPKILKYERIRLNLTQEELARRLNYTQRAVSYYETGKRDVPLAYLIKFADGAGLELRDLLGPDEADPRFSYSR